MMCCWELLRGGCLLRSGAHEFTRFGEGHISVPCLTPSDEGPVSRPGERPREALDLSESRRHGNRLPLLRHCGVPVASRLLLRASARRPPSPWHTPARLVAHALRPPPRHALPPERGLGECVRRPRDCTHFPAGCNAAQHGEKNEKSRAGRSFEH